MNPGVDKESGSTSLLDAVSGCPVVLCAGPGGVGKTTSSAAIALAAAVKGKKALVLTIDPARRLADALGVGLDNQPTRIDASALAGEGVDVAGELWAVMLDPAMTFDEMVTTLAPKPENAQAMFENPVYIQISKRLAGAVEYTAVDKLYSLHTSGEFDLIVVDTPPSKNVLDFIDAPDYMAKMLDPRILKLMLIIDPKSESKGFGQRLVKRTSRLLWDVLNRALGSDFVRAIFDFLHEFAILAPGLRTRCAGIRDLLRSENSIFFVVATPDAVVAKDAAHLRAEMTARGIPFGGFVVNRVEEGCGTDLDEASTALQQVGGSEITPVIEKLIAACHDVDAQARRDDEVISKLRRQAGWDGFVARLPRQTREIHDLVGLHGLAARLVG